MDSVFQHLPGYEQLFCGTGDVACWGHIRFQLLPGELPKDWGLGHAWHLPILLALCRWVFFKECHLPMKWRILFRISIAIKPVSVLRQSLILDSMTYHSRCTSSRVVIIFCPLGFGILDEDFLAGGWKYKTWLFKITAGVSKESVQDGSWVSRELRMPKDAPVTRLTWKVGEVLWWFVEIFGD